MTLIKLTALGGILAFTTISSMAHAADATATAAVEATVLTPISI